MVQVYKITNVIDMINKEKLSTMSQYTGKRGHSFKIYKKRFRLNIPGNYLSKRGVGQWNELPKNTVNVLAPIVNSFKSRRNKVQPLVLYSRRKDKTLAKASKYINRGCRA